MEQIQQLIIQKQPLAVQTSWGGVESNLHEAIVAAVNFVRAGGICAQILVAAGKIEGRDEKLHTQADKILASLSIDGVKLKSTVSRISESSVKLTITTNQADPLPKNPATA